MEAVFWQWGPFSIAVYSLAFFSAAVIGVIMVYAGGRRKYLPEQRLIDFIILILVAGITGSRLTYALLFDFHYYYQHPVYLFRLQDGGLSFWGGLLAALIAVSIWAARKRLVVERYLDAAAPALVFALALGRIGYALQGKAMPAALPWGLVFEEGYCHPDGAYAIVLLMVLFFVIRHRRPGAAYDGELFIWFLLGYGLINFGLDFVRAVRPVLSVFSAGQLASLAAVIFSLIFIFAGPKISITPYLGRTMRVKKTAAAVLGQVFLFLLLSGGMVTLYYLAHRSPSP